MQPESSDAVKEQSYLTALGALRGPEGQHPGDHAHVILANRPVDRHHGLGGLVGSPSRHHQLLHIHQSSCTQGIPLLIAGADMGIQHCMSQISNLDLICHDAPNLTWEYSCLLISIR